ncbi:MAG: hypothetical protein ACK5M7_19025 [Draconibacterium sp.]
MNRKEYIDGIHEYIEKLNFDFDRLNEFLFLIEEEILSQLKQMQQSSFEESLMFFVQLEVYNEIVAKCYYNRYKIEISDKLFLFMNDFERSYTQVEKRRIWNLLRTGEHDLLK